MIRDLEKELGKTYTCVKCGKKFKLKFKDSKECLGCRGNIHLETNKRLSSYFKSIQTKTVDYARRYRDSRSK
jgi:rRNA maturation endonuclease Nob1